MKFRYKLAAVMAAIPVTLGVAASAASAWHIDIKAVTCAGGEPVNQVVATNPTESWNPNTAVFEITDNHGLVWRDSNGNAATTIAKGASVVTSFPNDDVTRTAAINGRWVDMNTHQQLDMPAGASVTVTQDQSCLPTPPAPVINWKAAGTDCKSDTYPVTVIASADNEVPVHAQVKVTNGSVYDYNLPAGGGEQTQNVSIAKGEAQEIALFLVDAVHNPDQMAQDVMTVTAQSQEECNPTPTTTPPQTAPPSTNPPPNQTVEVGTTTTTGLAKTGAMSTLLAVIGSGLIIFGLPMVLGNNAKRRREWWMSRLKYVYNRIAEDLSKTFDNREYNTKAATNRVR